MTTIPGVILDGYGNTRAFVDRTSGETLARLQPVLFEDDFVGAGHTAGVPTQGSPVAGYPWVKRIVGAAPPTVAIVANSAAGIISCALTATSEKQEATLYQQDQLTWDATKGLVYEARVALSVLPSVAGVEAVFGLQSAWIDGPDNASFYLRFQANGSGLINCQAKDGVTTSSVSSVNTFTAGAFHVMRIDVSNVADVGFYIDGVRVNANGSVSFLATGSNAILQLYSGMYKPSGTGVGTLQIDSITATSDRV